MSFRLILLTTLLALSHAGSTFGQSIEDAFLTLEAGIEKLENREPDAQSTIALAASELDSVIHDQSIRSPEAYHALGNAYALQGKYGYAMLAYRRGQQLDPRDPKIRDSLDFIRSQIQISVEPSVPSRVRSALISWRGIIPRSMLWWAFYTLFTLGWLVLIVRQFSTHSRSPRLVWVWLFLAAALPLAALSYEWMLERGRTGVVITQDSVIAMSGPDDSIYDPVYAEPLQGGVEGILLETRDAWALLRLIDGSECWVPLTSVGYIQPPDQSEHTS